MILDHPAKSDRIKVLLVDDSPIALAILKRMLATSPDIQVVGTALNGKKAMDIVSILEPDVVCTDLNMPIMNGLEFTKQLMVKKPKPILVISTDVHEQDADTVFSLLEAGALDVYPKPKSGLSISGDYVNNAGELVEKIKTLSRIDVSKSHAKTQIRKPVKRVTVDRDVKSARYKVLVFGASIGGPQALKKILPQFPFNFPIPIFCVQRIKEEFLRGLIDWLSLNCKMRVRIAQDGEEPLPGVIYFPKENSHLQLDKSGKFTSAKKLTYKGYRPSITVTLDSASDFYGPSVIGVLLSGLGSDGVEGMEHISENGGITICQTVESSVVSVTISQAIERGIVKYVLEPEEIPYEINQLLKK